MTTVRNASAMRRAAIMTWKHSSIVAGAMTTCGASPGLREERGQQVRLLHLGRQSGARAAALHVDEHERDLGHHREAEELGLEREPRAGGHGEGHLAGVRGADGHADGRDLVLRLVHDAAEAVEDLAQVVRDRSRGRDRVHRAQLHAGGDGPEAERLVAVHDDQRAR